MSDTSADRSGRSAEHPIRAVIFDLGGVVFPSPFEAFDVYDGRAGLDVGTTRAIVRVSSETGAWAALERGELTMAQFCAALDAEAAELGHTISTFKVMSTIGEMSGARPEMVNAIQRLREHGIRVGALTNNWADDRGAEGSERVGAFGGGTDLVSLFDTVVESSRVGLRKPDPRIYALVCDQLGVNPSECAFLDDLGINLKPARELGMTTIKVVEPVAALQELSAVVGIDLGARAASL
jgi:putative hydrolase of the HAD superfamily